VRSDLPVYAQDEADGYGGEYEQNGLQGDGREV